jgi:hypothetical protein
VKSASVAFIGMAVLLPGCVVHEPVPLYVVSSAVLDRSWAAAVGALQDQEVTITLQDRERGALRGNRDGIDVTGSVLSQADGSVRVRFNTSGATKNDPELIDRIRQSYDRRMGR